MFKLKKETQRSLICLAVTLLLYLVLQLFIPEQTDSGITLAQIPEYDGAPVIVLNGNLPLFDEDDLSASAFESYSNLDGLGRCTEAMACISKELMPKSDRESISEVRPTGWQSVRYDFIDGESLYNRCHLIAFQLTGENANERNLITGTRHMNAEGMLPYEEMVGNYVRSTGNRVLYRVTPMFEGNDLVAKGVRMEAWSVEDNGAGICFHVFCYNVQPGIEIDYASGDNWEVFFSCSHPDVDLVLNTSSLKYHLPSCDGARDMNRKNRKTITCCPEEAEAKGYSPCSSCNPDKIIE